MVGGILGVETEYGLLVNQDRPVHSPAWVAHRIRDHLFQVQRRGLIDLHHRGYDEPPGNGGFLTNAGRVYLDMGHLEYASPECNSLIDLVAADRAGDCLLQDALEELDLTATVSLIKNNIDHETDATFGSHENYLVSRRFPFTRRGLGRLLPFLVTRQIFAGAGRVGAAATPDGWIPMDQLIVRRPGLRNAGEQVWVPYQISQRADHIVNDFFEWVQQNRVIVNTRDEPLADPNQYRRIHLLLGDSNMSEYATALKVGTTALVLQLIEEGHAPRLELKEPVEALQAVSRDQTRTWPVTLASGLTMSAIDVQEQYLEAASRYVDQDEETTWVFNEWATLLQELRGDYTKLVGRVDWASKLWLLETAREEEQLDWRDPWLKSLDLEYHNLDRRKGLYFGLEEVGRARRLTTDAAVELAKEHPPRNTRAYGRGELVRHLLGRDLDEPPVSPRVEPQKRTEPIRRELLSRAGVPVDLQQEEAFLPAYVINWSAFQVRGQPPFPMPNPFKTYLQEVRTHLHHSSR